MENIAVICNYQLNPQRIGGMDRFFRAYDEKLSELGFQVTWFFSGGKQYDFYSEMNIHIAKGEIIEGFFLNHLKYQHQYDVIITHFITLCTSFFKKIKIKQNAFIIAVDHNPRPLGGFSLEKRIKKKIAGKLYSRYIDYFVGVSQYTVDCILQDYGKSNNKKTILIYNGIDTSIYAGRENENQGKFIVASHLRESKGIQDLIEAVNMLPEQFLPLLQIDIYGEGPLENHLKKLVRSYRLENQIKFKGSTSKLPALLKNYSFLLQPTYMECFSLSILESLAANVPVITTPVGGNPEIIIHGKNGYLFEPGNILELKNLLYRVMDNSLNIKEDVNILVKERFDLQQMVNQHIKLLKI
ncbi:MAG: glycosyltransferase family 4 protein [Bacteroidota bacterium]